MAQFRNRLHEQLARRAARDAFRGVSADDAAVSVSCDPCEESFASAAEDELRALLEAHYKSAAHRRATQLTINQQRALRE